MAADYLEIDLEDKSIDEKLDLIDEIEDSDYFGKNELNILSCLSHDAEEEIRARVAEILVLSDSQVSENILIKLLRDESELVRVNACDSLCNSKSLEVINLLKNRVLKDRSSLVRGYAALSIGDIARNECFNIEELRGFIRFVLKKENVNWVKINLYKVLIMLGDESYLGILINELNNRLYRNRCVAAKVLCDLCDLLRESNIIEIKLALKQRLNVEKVIAVRSQIEKGLNNKV